MPDVSIVVRPPDAEPGLSTPVQLKNSRFSRPFSMFVKMYGLPSYNGFNPTSFVAITYTILFGIMFGDLGQGLAIALLGLIINKKTGSELGAIFTRVVFQVQFLVYSMVLFLALSIYLTHSIKR